MENLLILMALNFMEIELNLGSTLSEKEEDIAFKIIIDKLDLNNFRDIEDAHEILSGLIRDYYIKSINNY